MLCWVSHFHQLENKDFFLFKSKLYWFYFQMSHIEGLKWLKFPAMLNEKPSRGRACLAEKAAQQRHIEGPGAWNLKNSHRLPSPLVWLCALRAPDGQAASVCANANWRLKLDRWQSRWLVQWAVRSYNARNKHTQACQVHPTLVMLRKYIL